MYDAIVQGFIDALNPEGAKKRAEARRRWCEEQLHLAEPWHDDIKWKKLLVIKGETYKPRRFFPKVKSCRLVDINDASMKQIVVSPCGKWGYSEKVAPRAMEIPLTSGKNRGSVIFDKEVIVPAIFETTGAGDWNMSPWMSLTPMEMLTLRPGTKRAKGKVIVAGLGLGHQLIEVSKRPQVEKLVLIERDRGLVDWLMPLIQVHMGHARHSIEIVIGDAYTVMPKMKADVALVDIFPSYGCNEPGRDRLRQTCPKIGFIWAWGCGGFG